MTMVKHTQRNIQANKNAMLQVFSCNFSQYLFTINNLIPATVANTTVNYKHD